MENLRLLEDIFLSQEEDDSNVEEEWLENNMPQVDID